MIAKVNVDTFAEYLRLCMLVDRMQIKALAESLAVVSSSLVSKWADGTRQPRVEYLGVICSRLPSMEEDEARRMLTPKRTMEIVGLESNEEVLERCKKALREAFDESGYCYVCEQHHHTDDCVFTGED
jgi:hypothetical protein